MPKGKPLFPSWRCRVVASSDYHGWNFGVSRDGLIIARAWHRDIAQEIAAALNVAEKGRRIEEYEMRTEIGSGNQGTDAKRAPVNAQERSA